MLWCFLAAMASRRTSIDLQAFCTGFSRFVFCEPPRSISAAPAEPRPKYLSQAIDLGRALCQGLQVKRA
jgi:hypothetical protein